MWRSISIERGRAEQGLGGGKEGERDTREKEG